MRVGTLPGGFSSEFEINLGDSFGYTGWKRIGEDDDAELGVRYYFEMQDPTICISIFRFLFGRCRFIIESFSFQIDWWTGFLR